MKAWHGVLILLVALMITAPGNAASAPEAPQHAVASQATDTRTAPEGPQVMVRVPLFSPLSNRVPIAMVNDDPITLGTCRPRWAPPMRSGTREEGGRRKDRLSQDPGPAHQREARCAGGGEDRIRRASRVQGRGGRLLGERARPAPDERGNEDIKADRPRWKSSTSSSWRNGRSSRSSLRKRMTPRAWQMP